MGGLCSCCEDQNSGASARTPLLSGTQSKPITTQHVPSYVARAQQQQGHAGPEDGGAGSTSPGVPPASARKNRPDDATKEKEFLTSIDQVEAVNIHQLPPQLSAQNKTFQDHAKLYNDLTKQFQDLRKDLHDFKAKFVVETSGIPVLADCLKVLAHRCGGAQLKAKRERHCVQLEYDRREVSEKCTGGPPEDTLEALELYNRINRLVKAILDRAPQVSRSLQIVLADEHELKKAVTKADLSPEEGTEALRRCGDNISRLRRLPGAMDTVQRFANKVFKEMLEGSKALLQEGEGGEGGDSAAA